MKCARALGRPNEVDGIDHPRIETGEKVQSALSDCVVSVRHGLNPISVIKRNDMRTQIPR
jgi:hypothetical protein